MPPLYPHMYAGGECRLCGTPTPPDEFINPEANCLGGTDEMAERLKWIIQRSEGTLVLFPANVSYWPGERCETASTSLGQNPLLAIMGGPADLRLLSTNHPERIGLKPLVFKDVRGVNLNPAGSPLQTFIVWTCSDVSLVGPYAHNTQNPPVVIPRNPQASDRRPALVTFEP